MYVSGTDISDQNMCIMAVDAPKRKVDVYFIFCSEHMQCTITTSPQLMAHGNTQLTYREKLV